MEIVSWIVWLLAAIAGWIWSIAWLLVGGALVGHVAGADLTIDHSLARGRGIGRHEV